MGDWHCSRCKMRFHADTEQEAIVSAAEHARKHEPADWLRPAVDRITEIAVKHGLVPAPPARTAKECAAAASEFSRIATDALKAEEARTSRGPQTCGGMNPRWDAPIPADAPPMTLLDFAQMSAAARAEAMKRLAQKNPNLQDAPYKGPAPIGKHLVIDPSIGFGCYACDGFYGSAKSFEAMRAEQAAHYATVEHDRNTEKMLRNEVDDALASVETARTALYDYLKSKGRVA